ncbi:MAG: hypothetical protein EXR20_06040 [Bacteroidetes bacterium]|jgi:uncharacterized membrane protein|nr:hypothetical protein [Bacteroidota bacterium]
MDEFGKNRLFYALGVQLIIIAIGLLIVYGIIKIAKKMNQQEVSNKSKETSNYEFQSYDLQRVNLNQSR